MKVHRKSLIIVLLVLNEIKNDNLYGYNANYVYIKE